MRERRYKNGRKILGVATVAIEGVDVIAVMLWPSLLLLLSLGRVGVLEVVGTADTMPSDDLTRGGR